MTELIPYISAPRRTFDIDLVADFTCPWSWLGMAQVGRALGNLQGSIAPEVRWHPFRLRPASAAVARADSQSDLQSTAPPDGDRTSAPFRQYLEQRLPNGITVDFAERTLREAGRELGLRFNFDQIETVPDTTEAHRLTFLAANEGLQAHVAAAIFRAYFESGRDIGNKDVLSSIGADAGMSADTLRQFRESNAGSEDLVKAEERLRGFGVRGVPNLLFNGRVFVPGAVDVNTYILALDQALFPASEPGPAGESDAAQSATRILH
ncbi:MAG TPA: DsbA family oxidoreductase [Steroidobacteraceae bacterium]|nr:DsbA family oxidoreductase [Steroidobacteraceae bacterium]HRX90910.1 DsbA family oxidoreductase [Steroidobacteraceae bacterium]